MTNRPMSNIDKRAYRADGGDIGTGRLREIADNPYGDEEKCWLAKRVLALLDELEAKERWIAEQSDYFSVLVAMARKSADKAMRKFPQPNYVLLKVAEEAGEVVQAGVHYAENRMTWEEVEGEIIQLLAMLIRLVTEGDQINGITPPQSVCAAAAGKGE